MSVSIFFCYAHEDELLLNKLKTHLRPLQRQGLIDFWYDRDISAGTNWEQQIKEQLNAAQIILLLISPDFMDSDYCYGVEMQLALERNERGEALVIPIILRPVDWQGMLGKLQALPTDAIPVMSSRWHSQDEAFFDVTEGIRKVVEKDISRLSALALPIQVLKAELPQSAEKVQEQQPTKPEPQVMNEDFSWLCAYTLTGHGESVTISPDGQTLAGSDDKKIKLWNPKTGDFLRALIGHKKTVLSLAFSPDGQILASASRDKTIKLWNPKTGGLLRTLTGHKWPVESVAISPDGRTLISCDYKVIKFWYLKSGNLLRTIKIYFGDVANVAISPDGQTLASSNLYCINLWSLKTGDGLRAFRWHHDYDDVDNLAFSPDGQTLAGTYWDKTIKLWNPKTGDLLCTLTGHGDKVEGIAFSPDGQILASASRDKTIKLWNPKAGDLLQTLTGHEASVNSVTFSPDGQTLASASLDRTIKIWNRNDLVRQ